MVRSNILNFILLLNYTETKNIKAEWKTKQKHLTKWLKQTKM